MSAHTLNLSSSNHYCTGMIIRDVINLFEHVVGILYYCTSTLDYGLNDPE